MIGNEKVFQFRQSTPIPSYLIAIGAGAIDAYEIGPRSSVWCEPSVSIQAVYEFGDTERFLQLGEELAGPYVWTRYDILLLPPSFPYGGMENPCLTFLTPSLLAGDRSLVDVVAHEISHSWTGNLVGCVNWEHFWLNEGFTMFLERKILGRMHGENYRQFDSQIGLADLRESVAQFGADSDATSLNPTLTTTDPDDVFSTVPYEKGYTLLYCLEELVGGPSVFEPFFHAHIQKHAGLAIDSACFVEFIKEYFADNATVLEKLNAFSWQQWLKGTGMPPRIPQYDQEMMTPCRHLASVYLNQQSTSDDDDISKEYRALSPAQRVMFWDLLLVAMQQSKESTEIIANCIDSLHCMADISHCSNVEILLKWHLLAIRSASQKHYQAAAHFATLHGRMKYCRPVFRELFNCGGDARQLALSVFEQHASFYHPIAAAMIRKDLHL